MPLLHGGSWGFESLRGYQNAMERLWRVSKVINPVKFRYTSSKEYHNSSVRNVVVWYTQFDLNEPVGEHTKWFVIYKRPKGYCVFDIFSTDIGKKYFQTIEDKPKIKEEDIRLFEIIMEDFRYYCIEKGNNINPYENERRNKLGLSRNKRRIVSR